MRRPALISLILIIFSSLTFARIDSDLDIFPQSVATVSDISSGFVNPAGLGLGWLMAFRFAHAFPDSSLGGDYGLLLANRGNLVSVQWLRHSNNIYRIKYLLAGGKQVFPRLFWGISFGYFRGSQFYKNEKVWKLGLMYLPFKAASMGFVADDLNEPEFPGTKLYRKYTLGLAYKLGEIRTVLSADASVAENQHLNKAQTGFRLEVNPIHEVTLVGYYSTDGMIKIGMAYHFEHAGIGAAANYHRSDYRGGNIYYNQLPAESTR